MIVRFFDRQDSSNVLNGDVITSVEALAEILDGLRERDPFFCELIGDRTKLLVGIGGEIGCAQFSATDGDPPYLMATVSDFSSTVDEEFIEFLAGDTPSPVPNRYALPMDVTCAIAKYFLETGERSKAVSWEEI